MDKIQKLEQQYKQLEKDAESILIDIAKQILKDNPHLDEFVCAMGTWYFYEERTDSYHHGGDDDALDAMWDFICDWDDKFYLTGISIRLDRKGNIFREW